MASSTIPDAVAALIALLNAATWPVARPRIDDGIVDLPSVERIEILDTYAVGDDTQQWAQLGHRSRDEQYAIEIKIHTPSLTVDSISAARERAFSLLAVVEDTVRTNVNLGVTGITSTSIRQPTHRQETPDTGQRWVRINTALRVNARI